MSFYPEISLLLWLPFCVAVATLLAMTTYSHVQLAQYLLLPSLFFAFAIMLQVTCLRNDCGSAAAYASSISRVAASVFREFYVFMAVSLVTVAVYAIERVRLVEAEMIRLNVSNRISMATVNFRSKRELSARHTDTHDPMSKQAGRPKRVSQLVLTRLYHQDWFRDKYSYDDRWWKRVYDRWLRVGMVLICITAVAPDAATDCALHDEGSCSLRSLAVFAHIGGIVLGIIISVLCGVGRAAITVRAHVRASDKAAEELPRLRRLLHLTQFSAAFVGPFALVFVVMDSTAKANRWQAEKVHGLT